jgi:hypothetical protein
MGFTPEADLVLALAKSAITLTRKIEDLVLH